MPIKFLLFKQFLLYFSHTKRKSKRNIYMYKIYFFKMSHLYIYLIILFSVGSLAQYIKPKLTAENTEFTFVSRKHSLIDSWLNILPEVMSALRLARDNKTISHNDVVCSLHNLMAHLSERMARCLTLG